MFYSTYFGVFLTMLIAVVHFFLAKKVFKNNRPSNFKVTCWALSFFGLIVAVNALHVIKNIVLDIPIGRIAENCMHQESREARQVSLTNSLMVLVINIYPVITIVIDLFLLAFVKRTVMPLSPLITVTGELVKSKYFFKHLGSFH